MLDESAWKALWIKELTTVFSEAHPGFSETLIWKAIPEGSRHDGNLVLNVFNEVASRLGIDVNCIAALRERVRRSISKLDYVKLTTVRREAASVVEKLARDFHLGFMANQNRAIREKLAEAGVLAPFSNVQVSDDVGLEKPDLNYFRHVLKSSGASASESIIIDDNPERGLHPAKQLGMDTIWFHLQEPITWPSQNALLEIADLGELPKILALPGNRMLTPV